MLGFAETDAAIIVADLEAGIGTLTRLETASVDATVVVVEPTLRSIDVGLRAVSVAEEQSQGQVVIVANKVDDEQDRQRILEAFGDRPLVVVPVDPTVDAADRLGISPVDHEPSAPAVTAIEGLVDLLGVDYPGR